MAQERKEPMAEMSEKKREAPEVTTILSSAEAFMVVRQLLGLGDDEHLTLDLVCQRAILGREEDRDAVLSRCEVAPGHDISLQVVREAMKKLGQEVASARMAPLQHQTGPSMDFDRAAELILGLCDYEVRQGWMKYARETLRMPDAEILAAAITHYTENMEYPYGSHVLSRHDAIRQMGPAVISSGMRLSPGVMASGGQVLCPEMVTFTERSGEASLTESFGLCGRPFTPPIDRPRVKYGCDACGQWAWELQKYLKRKVQAMERGELGMFREALPVIAAQCTCV